MADDKSLERDTERIQKEKARALAVTGIATLATTYVVFGCLLPVVGLVVVTIWLLYGGAAAALAVVLPIALVALLIYRASGTPRRK